MPDYEQLYHLMVRASEDAIAALETGNVWDAKRILVEAELAAEERYVESADQRGAPPHPFCPLLLQIAEKNNILLL